MTPLPEPEWISLAEAAALVQERTGASEHDLERSLLDAFRNMRVPTRAQCGSWFGHTSQVELGLEHWSDVAHISWEKNIFLRGGRDGYPADGFRDVEVHRVKLLEWHRGYIVPTAVADALKEDSSVVPFRQPQTLATRHHRKGTRPPGPYYETLKTLLTENRDRLRGMPIGKICTLMRDRLGLRKAKNIPRSNTHLAAMIHRALDEIDTEDEATS